MPHLIERRRKISMDRVLAMILAGGRGTRLGPLTQDRTKPAVPFGGEFRIIDFVINNFVNSGIFKIKVLTQFKADSLINHLHDCWTLSRTLGHYIDPVPAQMRTGEEWYKGTANAIYQNIYHIKRESPPLVAVFGGDHIYKMDVKQMIDIHLARKAKITVAAIPRPISEASQFGILVIEKNGRVIDFQEKPSNPAPMPDNPDMALVSMGNYLFDTDVLVDAVERDAKDPGSSHDFGKDILPDIIHDQRVFAYDFSHNKIRGMEPRECGYWRDVGSVEAYMEANMDLRSVEPVFNLYNKHWPLRTVVKPRPPTKFVFAMEGTRRGMALDSLVASGTIISGSHVQESIIGPDVFIHSYTEVHESIIMHGVDIGRGCRIRRAIIDKGVKIPEGTIIGYDEEEDRNRFFISPTGIIVIGKDHDWDA
jgi:glucose-1-phosphate adenylyltransferase